MAKLCDYGEGITSKAIDKMLERLNLIYRFITSSSTSR